MRILHLASADLWGGAEAQLDSLAGACSRLGLDVSAVLLNKGSQLGERLRRRGIDVLELDESRTSVVGLMRSLFGQVRRVCPDVIHTHRFKENILGGLVARMHRTGSIRTLHGAQEPELMRASLRRRALDFADAFAARRLQSHVVAVSQDLAGKVAAQYSGARITVIANGVDAAALRQDALPAAAPTPRTRFGFLGRLVPVKRVDLLIDAMAELRRISPSSFELVIVGEGPERPALEARVARLGLDECVSFVGFQANSPAWIASMDVVVLTSDHEGLPMVVLESLALGVPVVARAVGGIPEVLRSVDSTWLVDSASPSDIAHKLAPHLGVRRLTEKRSPLLPDRYSADTMARAYIAIYESAVRS